MIDIDGYVDLERIGRGGLGDVYRATRTSTGGTVAIKVLRDVSDESIAWHRTRRELTALVSLAGHANVIRLMEVLDLPEGPALVMEYAPGGSVAELMLRRDRNLSVGETALVGRQTASALVAAHERGIVHRDVKPQNLLIDAYGQVKLCDFGIAAMARSEEFQDRTSAISMRYASPEDLDDDAEVGPPSDVYSLGATLLHLARGAPPTLKERLAPWLPPPTDDEELAALDAVIAACLHPVPAERPSAADVADELERLGWSIDERNRSLAFEAVDLTGDVVADEFGDAATDPRHGGFETDTMPALRHEPRSGPDTAGDPAGPADAVGSTDDTEHRTQRRPSRAVWSAPWRRPAALAAGVAAVVIVALVLVLRPGGDPAVQLVDRPAGLPDIRTLEWPIGEVGECLRQTSERLDIVACDVPHDLQRFAVGTLDGVTFPPGAPFDEAAVEAGVESSCDDAFESFVGTAPGTSEFDVAFAAPSSDTWAQEDRTFQCLLGVAGRRIVGGAESSGR